MLKRIVEFLLITFGLKIYIKKTKMKLVSSLIPPYIKRKLQMTSPLFPTHHRHHSHLFVQQKLISPVSNGFLIPTLGGRTTTVATVVVVVLVVHPPQVKHLNRSFSFFSFIAVASLSSDFFFLSLLLCCLTGLMNWKSLRKVHPKGHPSSHSA